MPLFSARVDGMTCKRRESNGGGEINMQATSIASANARKHNGKQPGASSAACGFQLPTANSKAESRNNATHLAQLIRSFSLGCTAAGNEEALLVEGAHNAQRIVDAALVLVQGHLVAASVRGVRVCAGGVV